MKYFLIGFIVWLTLATLPQLIRSWIHQIQFNNEKKRAKPEDKWMYE